MNLWNHTAFGCYTFTNKKGFYASCFIDIKIKQAIMYSTSFKYSSTLNVFTFLSQALIYFMALWMLFKTTGLARRISQQISATFSKTERRWRRQSTLWDGESSTATDLVWQNGHRSFEPGQKIILLLPTSDIWQWMYHIPKYVFCNSGGNEGHVEAWCDRTMKWWMEQPCSFDN